MDCLNVYTRAMPLLYLYLNTMDVLCYIMKLFIMEGPILQSLCQRVPLCVYV